MRWRVASAAAAAALLASAAPAWAVPVPPPAPKPTDGANSPAAPDPRPPRGGLAPDGTPVGGERLLSRRLVLPEGVRRVPQDITARAWLVTDLDTGRIVAGRDPHGRYQPASIQKVLTAVTLLPRLPGSRTVTVSRRSAETEGSHAGLVKNGRYSVDDLFRGLLLVSGNDCAEALAAAAGGRARTVALMNDTVRDLGAYDTYVETPSGLDGWKQLTSAYDMTLVLRAAMAMPRFVTYDRVMKSTLPFQKIVGRVELYNQSQQFLQTVRGALVAKTGFTDAAQHTFVGAVKRDGHRYGVVMLRAQRWPLDQWQQATRLVNWASRLPSDARVGTLATPPRPESRTTAPSASPSPSRATAQRANEDDGVPTWTIVLGAALLIGAAAAAGHRFIRRS